jgi:hypothetical protein
MMTYYSFEGERYDTYEEAENDARKAFDYEFVDYFDTLIEEGDIDAFDILEALRKGNTDFYIEVYEKCFNRYKDDYLVEVEDWEEEEEED